MLVNQSLLSAKFGGGGGEGLIQTKRERIGTSSASSSTTTEKQIDRGWTGRVFETNKAEKLRFC